MNILEALEEVSKGKKIKSREIKCVIFEKNKIKYRKFPNGSIFKLISFSLEEVKSNDWSVIE